MKIIYLAPETGIRYNMSGGAGTHMRGTVESLKENNDVIVAVGGDLLVENESPIDNQNRNSKKRNDIKSVVRSLIKKILLKNIKLFYNDLKIIKENQKVFTKVNSLINLNDLPDIIYERSAYGFDVGYKISKKYNIPLVLESDVIILDLVKPRTTKIFNSFFYKIREKKKVSNADGIVVMSEPSIQLMKQIWQVKHDRIFFKGLGINLNKGQNINKDYVDEKYDLKGKFIIGYVGIFQDYQNIPILFEVAKLLKNDNFIFLIVGTGSRLLEYKTIVKNEGLTNVVFTGLIDKDLMDEFYDRIDLGVITDNAPHMYPVKYLEFISKKVLTVSPNYPSFNIFFENEDVKERFTFEAKNPLDLKNKIIGIKRDLVNSKELMSYSKRVVKDQFTWAKCGERLEHSLKLVLEYKK